MTVSHNASSTGFSSKGIIRFLIVIFWLSRRPRARSNKLHVQIASFNLISVQPLRSLSLILFITAIT